MGESHVPLFFLLPRASCKIFFSEMKIWVQGFFSTSHKQHWHYYLIARSRCEMYFRPLTRTSDNGSKAWSQIFRGWDWRSVKIGLNTCGWNLLKSQKPRGNLTIYSGQREGLAFLILSRSKKKGGGEDCDPLVNHKFCVPGSIPCISS